MGFAVHIPPPRTHRVVIVATALLVIATSLTGETPRLCRGGSKSLTVPEVRSARCRRVAYEAGKMRLGGDRPAAALARFLWPTPYGRGGNRIAAMQDAQEGANGQVTKIRHAVPGRAAAASRFERLTVCKAPGFAGGYLLA